VVGATVVGATVVGATVVGAVVVGATVVGTAVSGIAVVVSGAATTVVGTSADFTSVLGDPLERASLLPHADNAMTIVNATKRMFILASVAVTWFLAHREAGAWTIRSPRHDSSIGSSSSPGQIRRDLKSRKLGEAVARTAALLQNVQGVDVGGDWRPTREGVATAQHGYRRPAWKEVFAWPTRH
jgi:hypothetical protein